MPKTAWAMAAFIAEVLSNCADKEDEQRLMGLLAAFKMNFAIMIFQDGILRAALFCAQHFSLKLIVHAWNFLRILAK